MRISDHWANFIEFRTHGDPKLKLKPWREKTLIEYQSYWARSFKSFWGELSPEDFEANWELFIASERARSQKGAELEFTHHIKYLNTFLNYLVKNDVIKERPNLFDPNWISSEGQEDEEKVVFSDEQARAMIKNSSGSFGLYIRMGLLMGFRSSEITQMQFDRIDFKNNTIKLRAIDVKTGSKTNRGRTVSIHEDVIEPLQEQCFKSDKSNFLFPNKVDKTRPMSRQGFKLDWVNLLKKCGIPKGSPHSMRHTCATKLFSNPNLNPALICKSLGFSMQIAEKVYINFKATDFSLISKHQSYEDEIEQVD